MMDFNSITTIFEKGTSKKGTLKVDWGMIEHFSFHIPHSTFLIIFILLLVSCSSIDCPMNNTVSTKYGLYKSDGRIDTLRDTLTVITKQRIAGQDPVALNRSVNTTSMDLPISYQGDEDVLYFLRSFPYQYETTVINEEGIEVDTILKLTAYITDTVTVVKTNRKHFEAIDCTPSFFHTIRNVSYTRNGIDSIVINNPEVNYDASKEHFRVYFKSRD